MAGAFGVTSLYAHYLLINDFTQMVSQSFS